MRLQRIDKGIADNISVEDVKQYANISTATRDEEIASMLVSSINMVEEIADVSLTANTFKFYSEKVATSFRLFCLPVSTITSVRNAVSGEVISYTSNYEKSEVYITEAQDVIIEYTTTATQYNAIQYKPYVLEICSAYYDGVTDNAILGRIYAKIPRKL